jgi:hypothetical protein
MTTTKPLPEGSKLIEILKTEFSARYAYKLFGLDGQKSILVGESAFVGAQITWKENEVTIQASPPSVFPGNFLFFFSVIGIDVILGVLFSSKLKKIEKEVATFLKSKFSE